MPSFLTSDARFYCPHSCPITVTVPDDRFLFVNDRAVVCESDLLNGCTKQCKAGNAKCTRVVSISWGKARIMTRFGSDRPLRNDLVAFTDRGPIRVDCDEDLLTEEDGLGGGPSQPQENTSGLSEILLLGPEYRPLCNAKIEIEVAGRCIPLTTPAIKVGFSEDVRVIVKSSIDLLGQAKTMLDISVAAFEAELRASSQLLKMAIPGLKELSFKLYWWGRQMAGSVDNLGAKVALNSMAEMRRVLDHSARGVSRISEHAELLEFIGASLDEAMREAALIPHRLPFSSARGNIRRFREIVERVGRDAVRDARQVLAGAGTNLRDALRQTDAAHSLKALGKRLAFVSAGLSIATFCLADETGRAMIRELPKLLIELFGAAYFVEAVLPVAAMCGPAAPACAFLLMVGIGIAAWVLSEHVADASDEKLGAWAQRQWDGFAKLFR